MSSYTVIILVNICKLVNNIQLLDNLVYVSILFTKFTEHLSYKNFCPRIKKDSNT